ncbi:MAG: response regulator [Myxococcales bacterium]|nr:response regulator [Myxococcales bacterium]
MMAHNCALVAASDGTLGPRVERTLEVQVRNAKTLRGLRRHIKESEATLLVADTQLPGLVDFVQGLRGERPAINVLLLTDAPSNSQISSLLEPGVVDVLRKPFSDSELVIRVTSLALMPPQIRLPSVATPTPLHNLHDPKTGRIDAKRIARAYGLSLRELSKAIGKAPQTVSKTPAAVSLQPLLTDLRRAYDLLCKLLASTEEVPLWLNTPLPDFGGRQPISLIRDGQAENLRDFLEAMYAGGPS